MMLTDLYTICTSRNMVLVVVVVMMVVVMGTAEVVGGVVHLDPAIRYPPQSLNPSYEPPVAAAAASSSSSSFNGFCGRALSARSPCPAPAQQILNLSALSGTYFEIGSTARYKLRYELGLGCSQTDFIVPLLGPRNRQDRSDAGAGINGDNGTLAEFSVVSTGVRVVLGKQPLGALAHIADSSSAICRHAAHMCSITSPYSHLSRALHRLASVGAQIAGSSPYDSSTLLGAASVINASMSSTDGQLGGMSRSMQALSILASLLGQQLPDTPDNQTEALLASLRSTADIATAQARGFGQLMINNLTYVSALITQVSTHLLLNAVNIQDVAVNDLLELLREAVLLIDEQIESITDRLMDMETLLGSIGGPLTDMVDASYRRFFINLPTGEELGMSAAFGEGARRRRRHEGRVAIANGTGTATGDGDGWADVSVELRMGKAGDGRLSTAPRTGRQQSYRIIALEPAYLSRQPTAAGAITASAAGEITQYPALLLYSCEPVDEEATPGANEFILLASTPTVSPVTVLRLLELAAAQGVYTDCDAVFVPTMQRPDNCTITAQTPTPSPRPT